MRRAAMCLSVILLLAPRLAGAYTVVLSNGVRLEAHSPLEFLESGVAFIDADGIRREYRFFEVNFLGTRLVNDETVTNDDLLLQPGRAGVSVVGRVREAEEVEEPVEGATPYERTREYWQERYHELAGESAEIEQEIQRIEGQLGKAETGGITIGGGSLGVTVEAGLRQLEQRQEELRDGIEALRTEARHQRIPPGWVR